MNIEEAKSEILNMDIDELIETINGMIDIMEFPMAQIHDIDNEKYWDKIAYRIGAYELSRLVMNYPIPDKVKYFLYDEESRTLEYFDTKESIIEYFGINNLVENYSLDNE